MRATVFALSVSTGHPARTDCPHCQAPILTSGLRAAMTVMSSRCRSCGTRITVPPGVIEVLVGGVFALLAYRHAGVLLVLAFCWLAAHGTAVSLIDIAVHRIPNLLTISAYGGVTLSLATTTLAEHHPVALLRAYSPGSHWRPSTGYSP